MSGDESRASFYPQRLDAKTTQRISNFLFGPGRRPQGITDEEWKERQIQISKELEKSTIISGPNTLQALSYYGVLRDGLGSEASRVVSDVIKRISIANKGAGRDQATLIMRGGLPKEYEVRTGQV